MESTSQQPPVWPDALSQLNKLNIFAFTVGGAIVGGMIGGLEWGLAGLVGGGLAAIPTCGMITCLLDIRRLLGEIKDNAK